ncbi:MAG: TlpA family protein disulfide reductase [Actinobacteria bacterium]|nr:TlpA family protein disulfide reductase [Actinomycetota bacterium]
MTDRHRTLGHGTGGGPSPEGADAGDGAAAPEGATATRPVRAPRWVPAAIAGALVVGAALGATVTLLVTGDDAPDAQGAAAAAAGPGDGTASTITLPQTGVDDPDAYGTVEVTGAVLPRYGSATDLAVGMAAPEVQGADFDGNDVAITADGRAKLIVFLAHWCPYCGQEAPVIREWYAATELPDGVDVYTVDTLTDFTRSNYPPRAWYEQQSWNVPLLVDDHLDTVAEAFGLNAVPFWVLVNADGTIAGRYAGGGVPADTLTEIVTQLAGGATP